MTTQAPLEVLYEDRHILLVKKPAGVFSQSGAADTAADLVTLLTQRARGVGEEEPYIGVVHRLDCGVGGVMVYAKKPYAAGLLSEAFAGHTVTKEYLCVTEGRPEDASGELCDLLFKDAAKNKVFVVDRKRAGVKEARLTYTLLADTVCEGQSLSLLRVRLGTGRSHQIRAQLSHRGMPIVGDRKYGAHLKCAGADAAAASSIALWSYHLAFRHPANLGRERDGRRANPKAPSFADIDFICLPEPGFFPFSLFSGSIAALRK